MVENCIVFLDVVVGIWLLIELLTGDFRPPELRAVAFFLGTIGCSKMNIGAKPLYENTQGKIHFDKEEFYIAYTNITTSKEGDRFDEKTFITYADIEEVDLSRNLNCFRIVGDARRERLYKDGQNVVEQNPDEDGETFIYVSYDDDQNQLKDMIQQKTGLTVKEMEEE